MSNFKSIEELKKFRTLNQKCYQVGTKALLDSEKGCEHLQGELLINASMTEEQKVCLLQHGSEATRVSLNFGAVTKGPVEDIHKIIFSGLKKMDALVLQFTAGRRLLLDMMDEPTSLFRENDSLPNLRSIYLPSENSMNNNESGAYFAVSIDVVREFLGKLLAVAPNVKEIQNVDERLLEVINDEERGEAVKSLSLPEPLLLEHEQWADVNELRQKDLVALANSKPKLSKLSAHELNFQNPNVKAILESSKETLRKIRVPYHRDAGPGQEKIQDFPVLPLISNADFFTVIRLHQCIGAQQFGLSFPNLEKVRVDAGGWRHFQRFPVRRVFPTVRSLFMNFDPGTTPCSLMDRLMNMFPAVKSVTINWQEFSKNWTTTAKVWNHVPKQVRRLRLYNFNLEKYDKYGLDRLLTGVPKNMCRDLQKLKKDAIDFDRLRTKPSISSLESMLILFTVSTCSCHNLFKLF